jgi:glycyl-tRNA synthetase beta chain
MVDPRQTADLLLADLLLEVRAEEIPARMLEPATKELATRVFEELMARGLTPAEVVTGFTPRRLVLELRALATREPDRVEEVTGPPVSAAFRDGQPTQALLGFAKRVGLEPAALRRVQTERGEYLAASKQIAGQPTLAVLAEILPRVLRQIGWAKTMKWGRGIGPWVRPIHGIVALFGDEVVPFELFGIASGRTTAGHATLSPAPFDVIGGADYRRRLAALGIEVDAAERRRRLAAGMATRAAAAGGSLVEDAELLSKLAAICEIPGVMEGTFDGNFLAVPREVLTESLRDHQSALTAVDGDGNLLPMFLTVMDRADDPIGRVRSGNEWVVAARLADARFFYQEDRRGTLSERRGRLDQLTFQEKLGSYGAKTERLVALASWICHHLGWVDLVGDATTAAELLKVDLTTDMVREFTSLQGRIGGVYAREDGHRAEVWQAIYDQYQPAATGDAIPRTRVGRVVGLADRLDTLAGMFGLGLVPSGSKDPFGLRRAAQAAVQLLLEGDLTLDWEAAVRRAVGLYGTVLTPAERSTDERAAEVLATLRPFMHDRIRHLLGLRGFAYDEIEAALGVGGQNVPDLLARVQALHDVRGEARFLSVIQAAKRIANITRDAAPAEVRAVLLREPAEQALHAAYGELAGAVETAVEARDYGAAFERVAAFADTLDRFFVDILVMDEDLDLRQNRLALLQAIGRVVARTARLTEMVIDKTA